MDNASRTKRARDAVIHASLDIVAREGPSRLTLDTIALEAGMSKGAVTHHFPTKEAVLKAVIDYFLEDFNARASEYEAKSSDAHTRHRHLKIQVATWREVITERRSVAYAVLAAVALDSTLLDATQVSAAGKLKRLREEADDPDLATLRWAAARGLALTSLIGICPLSAKDRDRLYTRLLDDRFWDKRIPAKIKAEAAPAPKTRPASATKPAKASPKRTKAQAPRRKALAARK
jgi:AcrR family transcriptional regulator